MTNAWFLGATMGVPQSEHDARATTEAIRDDAPAEENDAPDWNEHESDDSGELTGLAPRMLAPETVESEQYSPFWLSQADENHNKIIDEQVASSGTAARREENGEQGHGSMFHALGIEPVIREGASFGADYFASHEMGVNQGGGEYMTPAESDNYARAVVAHRAENASREAYQSSLYDAYLNGSING